MKKLILIAVAVLSLGFTANAKLYLGGGLGFSIRNSNFSGYIAPEVGYEFNDNIAAGAFINLGGAKETFNWSINPYVRWTFFHAGGFGIFAEGTFGVGTTKVTGFDSQTNWNIAAVPGLSYRVNEHISFLSRICSLGYERYGDSGNFAFQLNMTPTIGFAYNF